MLWSDFFNLVGEDLKHHGGTSFYRKMIVFLTYDSFQLLFNARLLIVLKDSKLPFFPVFLMIIIRYVNLIVFSSIISKDAKIGKRCEFKHPIGIVIGKAIIGDDVHIFQQVTLGSKGIRDEKMSYPIIGNNVKIYSHCVLLGNIRVGNDTTIAANSVVIKNLEENSVYAGSPTKKIK